MVEPFSADGFEIVGVAPALTRFLRGAACYVVFLAEFTFIFF